MDYKDSAPLRKIHPLREELRDNVREVVKAFYFDQPDKVPSAIRLHLVREEVGRFN